MKIPTKILVPVDFSSYSEQALDYAVELAAKLDATVHVLSAVPIPAMGVSEIGFAVTASMIDKLVADSQGALDKLVEPRRRLAKIGSVIIRTGDPRDAILNACEEVGADLIVMGTHGRRGVSRALLGSVTEMVVRTAPCPVLTLRGAK